MVVRDTGCSAVIVVIIVNVCGRSCRSRGGEERGDGRLEASALGGVFCDVLDGHFCLVSFRD